MAIVNVQVGGAAGSGSVASLAASFGSNVASGNLLVVGCGHNGAVAYTVTDGVDTWTQDVESAEASNNAGVWHTYATTSRAETVTITNTGGNTHTSMGIAEFSGVDSGVAPLTSTGAGTSTTPAAGAIVSTVDGSLYVAAMSEPNTRTITVGSGFTLIFEYESGSNQPTSVEYQIKATAGSLACDWTLDSSSTWRAAAAMFEPPGAAGGAFLPLVNGGLVNFGLVDGGLVG